MGKEQDQDKPTAIIVGCGIGGIATAARLAKEGFQVTVFEKNDYSGGRCSLIERDGYRFDQGPSLLLLPDLFKQTFEDLGEKMEDWVDLIKCEPNYVCHFHDEETFTLSTDMALLKREVERFEGKDGFDRFLSFIQEAHRHYELAVVHVLQKNFPGFAAFLRLQFIGQILALHPFESIWTRVCRYFKTDRLRRVFSFAVMYMGQSPYSAPGTYSLLQYTELTEGIWYPRGGFWQVPNTLLQIVKRNNPSAKFNFNAPVSQVLLSPAKDRATGVRLESGEEHHADVVIVNADLVYASEHLIPDDARNKIGQLGEVKRSWWADLVGGKKLKGSCSSLSFYWSMDRIVDGLGGHNIFLAEDFKGSFDTIFEELGLPADPSFYVNVPSRIDPSAAPEGKDAIVILVPCGHIDASNPQDYNKLVARARKFVIHTLSAKLGLPDFEKMIVAEKVHDAPSWEKEFNLKDGSILGLAHNFMQVLGFRPSTRHPKYDKLFFVGASTHPGTGVPIVLAGAKLTANQVLESFDRSPAPDPNMSLSVPYGKPLKSNGTGIDSQVQLKFMDLERWVYLLVLLIGAVIARSVGVLAF